MICQESLYDMILRSTYSRYKMYYCSMLQHSLVCETVVCTPTIFFCGYKFQKTHTHTHAIQRTFLYVWFHKTTRLPKECGPFAIWAKGTKQSNDSRYFSRSLRSSGKCHVQLYIEHPFTVFLVQHTHNKSDLLGHNIHKINIPGVLSILQTIFAIELQTMKIL